jgi:hypothetical protein
MGRILKSKVLWLCVAIIAIVMIAMAIFSGLTSHVDTNRADYIASSIQRAAVQCYALEGSYPSSLSYLEDNYNLTVDHDHYDVLYMPTAGNLAPQIKVWPIGG